MASPPRKMGWLENFMHTVPKCNVIVAGQIDGGVIDAQHFEKAVVATAARHPQLRSIIDEKTTSFVEQDQFVPGKEHFEVIDVSALEEWKSIADKESNLAADMYGKVPLWKFILVRSSAEGSNMLLIKFHHCIGDGSSGYIMTNDVLTFCQRLIENGDVGDINPLPRKDSADKMALPGGITEAVKPAADKLYADFTKRRCEWTPSTGLPFGKVNGEHNATLYRDGAEGSTDELLKVCRQKKLTIGAVLVAGTYFAVAKMDKGFCEKVKADPKTKFSFDFDMDVNLRKRLEPILGNEHVGTIIGMMSFSLSISGETKFWDFVAEVRTAMNDFLEANYHCYYFDVNERFDAACESMPAFQDNVKKNDGRVQDMNFSSFGNYFFKPDYGKYALKRMYCTGGGWCPTFGACVFLILGLRSRNFYTFVYAPGDGNEAVAEEFFGKACDIIEISHTLNDAYSLNDWVSAAGGYPSAS